MKFTIAIPTYNNEKTIKSAVLSAVAQDFAEEYEILVVNNASKDNTLAELSEFSSVKNFRVVSNVETVSLFENHNVCLEEAKGRYVIFCHSDDALFDDALHKFDNALRRYDYPSRIVCWGRSYFRDFSRSYAREADLNDVVAGMSAQFLFQYGGLTPSGTCYSKDTFFRAGGFLPMKSNITPSDMTSMLLYSLSGADFLMFDRMVFKRNYASTASGMTRMAMYLSKNDAMNVLSERIGIEGMQSLYNNLEHSSHLCIEYINLLEKCKIKASLNLRLRFIKKNPRYLMQAFFSRYKFLMLFRPSLLG